MNKNMSAIWDDEMDKMLVAFKHQAKASLKAMISAARSNGILLSTELKEYFLSAANVQTHLNSRADSFANMPTAIDANKKGSKPSLIVAQVSKLQSNDLIELLDSDDEASMNRADVKSETNVIDLDASAASNSRFEVTPMLNNRNNQHTRTDSVNSIIRAVLLNPTSVIGSTSRYTEGDEQGHGPSENRSIELNGSSVETNGERIVIKAEPTEATSCGSKNNDRSGDKEAIIQIIDSDDEEMHNSDGGEARANEKDNTKPKQEAIDDDIPLVLVEVSRGNIAPNGNAVNKGLNGSQAPMHGMVNGEATLHGNRARTTLNRESSSCPPNGSSWKATRKVGIIGKELEQDGPSSRKLKHFKCRHCDYASSYKGDLKTHMRIHTGEKPYRCNRCNKRFSQHANLKVHMKVHAEEFPFHCPQCFVGFSLEDEKKSHEMLCKTRRYECCLCKKFNTHGKYHLKTHMRKHSGEKPFRCEVCMRKFARKDNLKNHLDNVHA